MSDVIGGRIMISKVNVLKIFKKMSVGISAISLVFVVSFLAQFTGNTHAANTLASTSAEVVTLNTTDSLPPNGSYLTFNGSSADGNVILFSTNATNLPDPGTTTHKMYVHNIRTNTTERVDVSSSGVLANDNLFSSGGERISESGRYVTFMSKATNLIDGVTGPSNTYTLLKRDMQDGITTKILSRSMNAYSDNHDRNLGISNDGRFVLIASRYIGGNTYPYYYRILVGDSSGGSYTWTSLGSGHTNEGGSGSDNTRGDISCDGSFAVFNDNIRKVPLIDLRDGGTSQIAISESNSVSPIISCNGRYVLYATDDRTQITPTPSGMNSSMHLVRYDRITGERIYIDSNSSSVFSSGFNWINPPQEPWANAFKASIADTGDVVFQYGAGGYVYLKHLSDGSGTMESVAITTSGTYVNSANGEITDDGRYIFVKMDPYNLGLETSPVGDRIIRIKTNI